MKHKNIEVGMKLQNKETGKIYLVLSNEIDYFRLDGNYINSNDFYLDDFYTDDYGNHTKIIMSVYYDAKLFRKVKDEI